MSSWKPYLAVSAGIFLVSAIWVAAGLPLSPPGTWTEVYAREPTWVMALWLAGPAIALLGLAVVLSRPDPAAESLRILRLIAPWLLAALSFWTLKNAVYLRQAGHGTNYFYFTGTVGPGAFVGQAMNMESPGDYLRRFPEIASAHWGQMGGTRVISNPPGATLLMYGCRRLLEAFPSLQRLYAGDEAQEPPPTAEAPRNVRRVHLLRALAMFVPDVFFLLIALGMPPLWCLAHALLPKESAPFAAVTAALIPGLCVFSFEKDAVQLAMALWFWWALYRCFEAESGWAAFAAGLVLFVGLQFSLAFVVIAGLGAAVALLALYRKGEVSLERRQVRIVRLAGSFGAGLVLPAIALWLAVGYEPWKAMLTAWRGHQQYHRELGPSYSVWVWLNLVHLLLFMGAPAAASWLGACWNQIKTGLRERSIRALDPFLLGVTGVLLLLDLSGVNLSEVPRLWLFFMPALYLASERARLRFGSAPAPLAAMAALLVLQIAQASVFTICFDPLGASRPLADVFQGSP
jgi:hypothetical protein